MQATTTLPFSQPQADFRLRLARKAMASVPTTRRSTGRPLLADRWEQLAAQLSASDVEPTPDEFSAVWHEYLAQKRACRVFDPMLVALLLVLHRQALLSA